MQVTVLGWNYEGCTFRGIPSETDGMSVEIEITSIHEHKIANFILEEFSYGANEDVDSMDKVLCGYNDGSITNGDGCGGVVRITVDGKVGYEDDEDDYVTTFLEESQPIKLSINLETDNVTLNQLVKRALKQ